MSTGGYYKETRNGNNYMIKTDFVCDINPIFDVYLPLCMFRNWIKKDSLPAESISIANYAKGTTKSGFRDEIKERRAVRL